jgi:transmembrane sensor
MSGHERDDIATEAARRHLQAQSPDWSVADERALQDWLAANPLHARAFEQAAQTWAAIDRHAVSPEMMALRRDALDRARAAASRRWLPRGRRGVWQALAASVAVLLLAGTGAVLRPDLLRPGDLYETGVGERRVVTLQDGSRLSLDAGTQVVVRYTAQQRNLALLRGQARFDVAHDVARPFGVRVCDQLVVATGTSFNIDLLGRNALVTLIEGHVVLLPAEREGERRELQPGEQLVVAENRPTVLVPKADLERATAWQRGKLVFNDELLSDVVARVNRYAKTRVELGDAEVQRVRVSGVFEAGDVTAFVEGVTSALPVTATRDGRTIVLHSRAARL